MRKDDCIFCRIAAGEIPSSTVYEDEKFRVILDLGPAAKGHMLVLPKDHFADVTELPEEYAGPALMLGARLGQAAGRALGATGFNLVQNNGAAAGQTVRHFHLHVIPRYEDGAVIASWTPGQTTAEEREETAAKLRGAL